MKYIDKPTKREVQHFCEQYEANKDQISLRITHNDYIFALIERGIITDEMYDLNNKDVNIELKKNGITTDYYINHLENDHNIRLDIAENGKHPEEFLSDLNIDVRKKALFRCPEYIPYHFKDPKLTKDIQQYYETQKNPNMEEYKLFIKLNEKTLAHEERILDIKTIDIVRIKEAANVELTPLEKTMTIAQLYYSNNPAWAKELTMEEIYDVEWYKQIGLTDKLNAILEGKIK